MNYFQILRRSFREAPAQLWRNRFLSLTILSLLTVIFLVVNILASLSYLSDHFITQLEKRADFMIPLAQNYEAFTMDSVRNEIKQFQNIAINDEIIPARREGNVELPPYWHVHFKNLHTIEPFFEVVKKEKYAELFPQWDPASEREFLTLTNRVLTLRKNTETLAWSLMTLFGLIGIAMISQLFRLALYLRRDELLIARTVGADRNFLIFPIAVEGALLGVGGSILGMLFMVAGLTRVTALPSGDIFLYLWEHIFFPELLIAIMLGAFCAYLAVGRYLSTLSSS